MLSPSSSEVKWPRSCSRCSSVHATVDLPLPLRPGGKKGGGKAGRQGEGSVPGRHGETKGQGWRARACTGGPRASGVRKHSCQVAVGPSQLLAAAEPLRRGAQTQQGGWLVAAGQAGEAAGSGRAGRRRTCEPQHAAALAQQQLLVAARHGGLVPADVGAAAHVDGGQVGGRHGVVGCPSEDGWGEGGTRRGTSRRRAGGSRARAAGRRGCPLGAATSLGRRGDARTPQGGAVHGWRALTNGGAGGRGKRAGGGRRGGWRGAGAIGARGELGNAGGWCAR